MILDEHTIVLRSSDSARTHTTYNPIIHKFNYQTAIEHPNPRREILRQALVNAPAASKSTKSPIRRNGGEGRSVALFAGRRAELIRRNDGRGRDDGLAMGRWWQCGGGG